MLYPTVRVGQDATNVFEHLSAAFCEVSIIAEGLELGLGLTLTPVQKLRGKILPLNFKGVVVPGFGYP